MTGPHFWRDFAEHSAHPRAGITYCGPRMKGLSFAAEGTCMRRPSTAGLSLVVAAVLCAVAVIAAIISAYWVFGDPGYQPGKTWFYDLNTQQLFAAPGDSVPPIDAASGPLPDGNPAGVQAIVLESGGEKEVALLFTYDPETKAQLEAQKSGNFEKGAVMRPPLRLVRAAQGGTWVGETTEAGSKLMNQALKDVGQNKTYSLPPQ